MPAFEGTTKSEMPKNTAQYNRGSQVYAERISGGHYMKGEKHRLKCFNCTKSN